jgi:hypothetical protein
MAKFYDNGQMKKKTKKHEIITGDSNARGCDAELMGNLRRQRVCTARNWFLSYHKHGKTRN